MKYSPNTGTSSGEGFSIPVIKISLNGSQTVKAKMTLGLVELNRIHKDQAQLKKATHLG